MSKTCVLGAAGLQLDFGQVPVPSPRQPPSLTAMMTATSSAKPYESYRLKLLPAARPSTAAALTPSQQTLVPAMRARGIYSVCSPRRRKHDRIKIQLNGGKRYCLVEVAGEGTGERRAMFITRLVGLLTCSLSLEGIFLQSVGKTCPAPPGNSTSVLVREGHKGPH